MSLSSVFSGLGINNANIYENLFVYSLIACQSLDFATSAAGRIDVEAARYIRLAQGMLRMRVDIVLRQNFYGPQGKDENGEVISFSMAPYRWTPFGKIHPCTSEDSAEAFKVRDMEQTATDLVAYRTNQKVEGALLSNISKIVDIETEFSQKRDPARFVRKATTEDINLFRMLQTGAIAIADLLDLALKLLENKLLCSHGEFMCTGCGFLMTELPGEDWENSCPLCGSPEAAIIDYPNPTQSPKLRDYYEGKRATGLCPEK